MKKFLLIILVLIVAFFGNGCSKKEYELSPQSSERDIEVIKIYMALEYGEGYLTDNNQRYVYDLVKSQNSEYIEFMIVSNNSEMKLLGYQLNREYYYKLYKI